MSPVREMFTTRSAPRLFSAAITEREAPPEPNTSAFFPETGTPQRETMVKNPARSVLSPCQPFSVFRRVFTLPMAFATSEREAQKGMTAFLYGIVTFMPERPVVLRKPSSPSGSTSYSP